MKTETKDIIKYRRGNALRVATSLFGHAFVPHDLDSRGSKLRKQVARVLRSEMNYLRRNPI